MSRITFRTIFLVSSLVTLVLSFNLLVGAQDQTTTTKKQSDKTSQSDMKQKSSASDMRHDKDSNKGMQAGATGAGMLSNDDKKFVMEAAHGGMMEVELGKMATEKAMSEDVKQFGQRMVDDHSKANDELMQLASSKGITMNHSMGAGATASGADSQSGTMTGPNSTASADEAKMMKKHQEMKGKMSALTGAEFDRKYMEHMVKDHEKDVAAFERESTKGSDADVKAWAAKTLPTLREHLQMARATEAKVKGSSKGDMSKKP